MAEQPLDVTVKYLVQGMVQGVGYRYFVARRATGLGLKGWARNLSDGRVEVVARGTRSAQESLEAALRSGPAHAQVAGVENSEISDELEYLKSFDIK